MTGHVSESGSRQGPAEGECLVEGGCQDGTLSAFGAFFILTKVNWGIGMVAMPYYMHCAGLWCGLAFFPITMLLSADAALVLAHCRKHAPGCQSATTYADLIGACLGNTGRVLSILSMVLANWGSTIAWIRYIGDNLARFLPEANIPGYAWSLGVTVPLLACAFVENVAPMERFSAVGLVAGQAFVVVVVAEALQSLDQFPAYAAAQPPVRWDTFPVAMGLAVFCNEGMVVLTPSVQAEMRLPRLYPRALVAMTVYFTANYLMIALAGDFLFSYLQGAVVPSEMSLAFTLSPLHRLAVYMYVVQLLLSFPLVIFTVLSSIEHSWLQRTCLAKRRVFRAMSILAAGVLAVAVPHFGDFLAAAGGLANSLGIYILPHLALLRSASLGKLSISRGRAVASCLVAGVFGLGAGAVATSVSVKDLFS